ncbi:MAG TPA: AMP-binding protein, partial [Marinilabiliaceae bacterium]|nr:AMP-binding protein [Marinilabiliaceae bacterium]
MKSNGYISMVQKAIENYTDSTAFTDYGGESFTYREVGQTIFKLHETFRELGIKKGDKIALIGRNMSNWSSVYLSIITYGAVVVPILPDFRSNDIHHIVNHSEAVLLFSTTWMFDKIDENKTPHLKGIISINDFKPLVDEKGRVSKALAKADKAMGTAPFDVKRIKYPKIGAEEVMVLSYTSGTSGFSKGVLLPHRCIWSNVQYATDKLEMHVGDRIVSFLPLAHAYGCLFDFLWPFTIGCHITFLTRTPTPQIITEAFREVKPHLILSVPLILEKIFKSRIQPLLEKPTLKVFAKLPLVNKLLFSKIKDTLVETFGGEFYAMVLGGAALNKEVESFLKKINFPLTVGYGMTECGPLISYEHWDETKMFSAGRIVDRMEVRIDSPDPQNIVGEIQVKGDNLHLGYYKNETETKESFTEDGWLHTGDLGVVDSDGFIFIRGRSKNMILGPSGQNIYPEEIEAVISRKEIVAECLVREKDGKIEALIYPDYEVCDECKMGSDEIEKILLDLRKEVNEELPPFMQVSRMVLFAEEFEKTPKRSIKR